VVATRQTADSWARGYHLAVLAQAQLVSGDPEGAAGTLRGALVQPGLDGTAVQVLLRAYLAIALFILGRTDEARQLVDRTGPQVSPGVQLDLYVLDVVCALAAGDAAGAARSLATMTEYARAHGHLRYRAVADELTAALAAGTPLADLPRLVWGGGPSTRQAGDDQVRELR
jgi:hypothetical protein